MRWWAELRGAGPAVGVHALGLPVLEELRQRLRVAVRTRVTVLAWPAALGCTSVARLHPVQWNSGEVDAVPTATAASVTNASACTAAPLRAPSCGCVRTAWSPAWPGPITALRGLLIATHAAPAVPLPEFASGAGYRSPAMSASQ